MYGQFHSIPDKHNFFLPTHHSRRLRHLRQKAKKAYHEEARQDWSNTIDIINHGGVVLADNIATKEDLKYQDALRGCHIDPFSSVSGRVSLKAFLPPFDRIGEEKEDDKECVSKRVWYNRRPRIVNQGGGQNTIMERHQHIQLPSGT